MLYGLTKAQMKTRFIIAEIIGCLFICIPVVALIARSGSVGALLVGVILIVAFGSFPIMSFILNWRKIFKGIILPIPIVSYCIEYIKGIFMAFGAFFWMLSNKE